MALDGSGKVISINHTTGGSKKVFVVPGKIAIIEIKDNGKTVIAEAPIGQFGWEYEI